METERDDHLAFFDIDIYRRPDGSMGHKVYRKHTNNNLYLNPGSHHHPSNIKQFFQSWCTETGLFVTRKASVISWNSPKPFSGKMVIVSNRYNGPSTWQLKPPS
jgi:hypothetical protein